MRKLTLCVLIMFGILAGNAQAQQCPNCEPKIVLQTKEPPLARPAGCDCFKTGICDCGPKCACPGCKVLAPASCRQHHYNTRPVIVIRFGPPPIRVRGFCRNCGR